MGVEVMEVTLDFLQDRKHMEELVDKLNRAASYYYNGSPIMSDHEYDLLFDELKDYEERTKFVCSNSPTRLVGSFPKVEGLDKVEHEFPAKSLDKTKDVDKFIQTFCVDKSNDEVVLMWKLDGATVQLTYDNGKLQTAATRGDGYIGQDITHNAPVISGIPLEIEYKGKLVVRGEAVISYSSFNCINKNLDEDMKFKNPRNLAAASLTLLDTNVTKTRRIQFKAFELVYIEDKDWKDSLKFYSGLMWLLNQNFDIVDCILCHAYEDNDNNVKNLEELRKAIDILSNSVEKYDIPVDGLVAAFDDTEYSEKFKGTEHHPHPLRGYALKWNDEIQETVIRDIEWSPSRTGLLNPVAIFDPVELEGTTVTRASLHNISVMNDLQIRVGDRVTVYKANKIIPQIGQNLTPQGPYTLDDLAGFLLECPACGSLPTIKVSEDDVQTAVCENEKCPAKLLGKLDNFCSRDAMNIEGLSESTLEKFIDCGFISDFCDIYCLDAFEQEIRNLPGFGDKSYQNIWDSIQKSRNTTMSRLLVGLGIPGIGVKQAKQIAKFFKNDVNWFMHCNEVGHKPFDFTQIDGIGEKISKSINEWLWKYALVDLQPLLYNLNIEKDSNNTEIPQDGPKFVVTGKLNYFKNRKKLEEVIESNGGSVQTSVSKNTDYLINNDINSTSSKNKKAKELGVRIITEQEFMLMIGMGLPDE